MSRAPAEAPRNCCENSGLGEKLPIQLGPEEMTQVVGGDISKEEMKYQSSGNRGVEKVDGLLQGRVRRRVWREKSLERKQD